MKSYRRMMFLLLLFPALTFFSACSENPVNPEGFTGNTGGCGDFRVYKFNGGMTEAVVVNGTASEVFLDRTSRDFSLPHSAFAVRIERFSSPAYSYYCDDVADDDDPYHTWNAVSGRVQVAVGDTLGTAQAGWTEYTVLVSLHDVTFRDEDGDEVLIKELDFGEIRVGWFPG